MFPSSNDFSSSKNLISTPSTSSSLSNNDLPVGLKPHATMTTRSNTLTNSAGQLSVSSSRSSTSNSQRIDSDVTAETSLAESEPAIATYSSKKKSSHKEDSTSKKSIDSESANGESGTKSTSSISSIDTSYPFSNASSSRGFSSSFESNSANIQLRQNHNHHHRHHTHTHKSKQQRKTQPELNSAMTTSSSSSSSSESGSLSPYSSSVSSSSSLNENQPRNSQENNFHHFYHHHKSNDEGGAGGGKRFKIFNFLKIKSGMTKSKTVDQIKCICSDEKKFNCLKCTSNYPVHVNRSKDGEEDRGRSTPKLVKDLNNSSTSGQISSKPPLNATNPTRPPLVVSVPVRIANGSQNHQLLVHNHHSNHRMATRRTLAECPEHQSMPTSKTFSNFTSLSNPVPNVSTGIKLRPSPIPASNQLMSFLEQLNPSNSFKVPPNASPFT